MGGRGATVAGEHSGDGPAEGDYVGRGAAAAAGERDAAAAGGGAACAGCATGSSTPRPHLPQCPQCDGVARGPRAHLPVAEAAAQGAA